MPAKKLVLLILAVLLAFTAIDMVNWYASPEAKAVAQTGDIRTLKGESVADTIGQEPFQSIVFWLDAPLQDETLAVLTYYQEDYSSAKKEQHSQKGARQIDFGIPLGSYVALDCYINANVKIEKITISDQPFVDVLSPYPVRPLNILIPSAILLAVLFLFICVKPLNKFIKLIDRKIIDPETRYKGVTIAYIVLAVAALLHHIYVTMYHKYVLTGYTDLGVPLLVFSIITFLFGKLWKDKISWILLALLCLKYIRTALEGQQILNDTTYIYYMSIYAFFGCYGVSRVLSRKYWKPFLSSLCSFWTLAALVFAGIGIYVASAGVPIKNFGSEWFTVMYNRASYVYEPVTSGIVVSVSLFVACLGCFLTRRKTIQILYILAALVLFFAGSLTGTRTAYLLSALLFSILLYIPFRDKLNLDGSKNTIQKIGKHALLLISFAFTSFVVIIIDSYAVTLLKFFQVRSGLFISTAMAEGTAVSEMEIVRRDLGLTAGWSYFFNGRLEIWKNTLSVITSNVNNLLMGQSVYMPMRLVNEIRISQGLLYMHHAHNTLIQNFLELGLPGLLLYLSLIFTTLFHTIRIIRNKDLPYWQRILPIGAILCFAEGCIDNTCHVTYGYPQMTVLYLFAGFTIALGCQAKKNTSLL